MLKRLFTVITLIAFFSLSFAPQAKANEAQSWYGTAWQHVKDTWYEGDVEAYVPFLTYHLRYAYRQELLDKYNEYPAGFGIGKGRINASGNWEGMYAMGFSDSHYKPTFMAGYAWVPMWNLGKSEVKVGVGLSAFLMSRQDYMSGIPFPGVLPVASISYKNLAIQASYVPGGQNNGNVIFMWAKWTFK